MGSLRVLLGRRDWVYLLSLLIPVVIYNLVLKAYVLATRPNGVGLDEALHLMRSDIFFNLGYALLWIGLFAAVRRGLLRRVVVVLFHAVTLVVVLVSTCSLQYLRETGTTLDYAIVAEWIPKFGELTPILVGDVPLLVWGILAAALSYVAFGPALVTRVFEHWRGWPEKPPVGTVRIPILFGSLGVCLLAFGFGSLSLLTGPAALARDPVVNLILTGVEDATIDEGDPGTGPAVESPAANATLAETLGTEKRNVVLIHLESTRAQSTTPYNEDLQTTPFLDELSRSSGSLLAERAYTPVPRSSKASVSVNCGVEPPLYPGPEFESGGIPARCLATLLREQDYSTVFFASTANNMDNFGDVVQGFGYEEFYPVETMDKEGFQVTNTFGYEDDIM
ncbi:MAG: sulfatase-like hydrolase/transferase, partial [Actinomycetota bacterium]|nr:sulfatase-like hydrolase/transferase [Actinomycetota bacterium]